METTKCPECGADIVPPPDRPELPDWLQKSHPKHYLCAPCWAARKETEARKKRLSSAVGWTVAGVYGQPEMAMAKIGVPPRWLKASFDTCPDLPPDAVSSLRSWAQDPTGMCLLHGQQGAGKTWIAVAILKEAAITGARRLGEMLFRTERGYKNRLREDYQRGGNDVALRSLSALHPRRVPLLVFDEMGATRMNDWGRDEVAGLIEDRHATGLPTVITSNLTLSAIARDLDPRLASRIAESNQMYEFRERDLRVDGTI